ncbi:hypothetical protein FNV43_RR27326 [Rhamnella rubrinervis]|uniref:Uncharacterized protein n=1 Tax=Rhamnella rubrinervis TaxID=2594499 RepID=A0A8K0DPR7_9ROSA|nr:hypothetical protein FNV43_RR27326 [Rhamnella rubrinervis]
MIPHCLGNSSTFLSVLSLGNNSFHGVIPQICSNSGSLSSLRLIDLSHNKFQGQLPRSWFDCMMLEGIVVSNNQLVDTFLSWLRSLSELNLLVLHHNGFYGVIDKPKMDVDQLAKLQVIDLSSNNFIGVFPSHYITSWNAMKSIESNGLKYMSAEWNFSLSKNYNISVSTFIDPSPYVSNDSERQCALFGNDILNSCSSLEHFGYHNVHCTLSV